MTHSHVVSYDTGFPAPIQYGFGMYFTPEYVRGKLEKLKEEPWGSIRTKVPHILKGKSTTPKREYIPKAKTHLKTCKREACGKTFYGHQRSTLCSPQCRELWTKEYQSQWKASNRKKQRSQRPAIQTAFG